MSRSRASHERAYRGLLHLYPAAFRERYADEMVRLFNEQLDDARVVGAPAGVARTWLRTIGDLAVTAASERVRRDRTVAHSLSVPPSAATKVLGVLGIVGGLFLVAAFVVEIAPEVNFVRLVLFNVGAIAIVVAVTRRPARVSRMLSIASAVPAIVANAWYLGMLILAIGRPVYPEPDPEFRPIFFYAGIALWLTDAAFGAVALRIGVVWRWAALALTIGSLLAFTGIGGLGFTTGPFGAIVVPLTLTGVGLVGLGWILLGLDVATRRRSAATRTPELPRGR
jgi:hypothetical protein